MPLVIVRFLFHLRGACEVPAWHCEGLVPAPAKDDVSGYRKLARLCVVQVPSLAAANETVPSGNVSRLVGFDPQGGKYSRYILLVVRIAMPDTSQGEVKVLGSSQTLAVHFSRLRPRTPPTLLLNDIQHVRDLDDPDVSVLPEAVKILMLIFGKNSFLHGKDRVRKRIHDRG